MNLRSIDLNLLVALDSLLGERHVTRAAERVGLSQPAMSNALSRLRHIFRDELLVRTANGMQPTPHAEELREPVRQILRQIERVLESDAGFDPAIAVTTFSIRLSDILGYLVLPPLAAEIGRIAPGISLDVQHLSPSRTVDALERDEIHLALSMGLEHTGSIRSEMLLQDRMVCAMRKGHPLAQGALTLDGFLSQRHLRVSISPTDTRFVDNVLLDQRLERQIAVNLPHWLLVPHILKTTDLVSVMPGRIAAALGGDALVLRSLPFASEPFDWALYWHRRHHGSRGVSWLRGLIRSVFERMS